MLPKIFLLILIIGMSSFNLSAKTNFFFNKERNRTHISTSIGIQSSNIISEKSDNSLESNAEFSVIAQEFSVQYLLNDQFAISGSYYFALALDIDAEMQGIDIGVEYFPLKNGASKDVIIFGSHIETTPDWSPFIYLGASTRDVQFSTVNFKFQGIQVKVGSYWHFGENSLYLKGSIKYEKQYNNNIREISTTGAIFGIGKAF